MEIRKCQKFSEQKKNTLTPTLIHTHRDFDNIEEEEEEALKKLIMPAANSQSN